MWVWMCLSNEIVARWTDYYDSEGSVYAAVRPAPNRTNDPERNWGLGRE
ncbi:hypothetical protein SAMN05444354_10496 [Stigmatella aurantiaca]|uniref:Uncharacterized protein n=1 Tax=Stigmatella aurantiaca TaxID=41 RepID=A0A1H7MS96_STIAU|nr:hypothetical protein SAMN05444354_10496 [Stigmatella aurantiaca]